MKVVISGGSGLIGRALATSLASTADVAILTRNPSSVGAGRPVRWDPSEKGDWVAEVAEADAVINLAGAGIADRRWNAKRRRELRDSRVTSTRGIVEALGTRSRSGRPVLISSSAIGFYGDRGEEELDESSAAGEGFLSELSIEWEEEARRAESLVRLVILRTGIVLAREGGALAAMLPIFRLGLGGPLGSGKQWMSWIHIDDLVGMIARALSDAEWEGAVNGVAPEPVRNAEFSRVLGRVLRRPAFLPAPGLAIRLVVGEMADPLLLTGQKVVPAAARERGFAFGYSSLEPALRQLLHR